MNETTRELLEKSNKELFEANQRANAIIGHQADEMKQLQDKLDTLRKEMRAVLRRVKNLMGFNVDSNKLWDEADDIAAQIEIAMEQ